MSDSPAVIIYDSGGNPVKLFDLDTGAGSEYGLGVSIRLPSSGGSVPGGTDTNPIRIDPIGSTTQPISALSLPLPLGASTEVTLAARLADSTFTSRINTLGQKTMTNSTPVVLASDQSILPITGTVTVVGTTATGSPVADNPIRIGANNSGTTRDIIADSSGRLIVAGAGTAGVPAGGVLSIQGVAGMTTLSVGGTVNAAAPSWSDSQLRPFSLTLSGRLRVDSSEVTQPISAASLPLPGGAATESTLNTRLSESTFTSRINTLGQKVMAGSLPVVLASDQATVGVREQTSTNATLNAIPASNSDTLLVATNANRKKVFVFNDSTAQLYIGLGDTATDENNYSFILAADTIWEIPGIFTGEVRGYWTTATGFARITELV